MGEEEEIISASCVLIGDNSAGKSTLLANYLTMSGQPIIPNADFYEDRSLVVNIGGQRDCLLSIQDTRGGDDQRLRPLLYRGRDVIVICFSLVDRLSFDRLATHQCQELRRYISKKIPWLLVGNKLDLREDKESIETCRSQHILPISRIEGLTKAQLIGAEGYLECSAISGEGVSQIFEKVIQLSVDLKDQIVRNKSKCTIV